MDIFSTNDVKSSRVLAEALEQIDALILAGTEQDCYDINTEFTTKGDLDKNSNDMINDPTNWTKKSNVCPIDTLSLEQGEDPIGESITKSEILKMENDNLLLQVEILKDQVECQAEKIEQLQNTISGVTLQLESSQTAIERTLQENASLQNDNSELLNQISFVKVQNNIRNNETVDVQYLQSTVLEKEKLINSLRLAFAKLIRSTGYPLNEHELSLLKGNSGSPNPFKNSSENLLSTLSSNSTPSPETATSLYPLSRNKSNENMEFKKSNVQRFSTMPRLHGPRISRKIEEPFTVETNQPYALVSTENEKMNDNSAKRQSNPDLVRSSLFRSNTIHEHKSKGFKRIFDIIKKSGSSSQNVPREGFIRGGTRATTGSREGYMTIQRKKIDVKLPFARWDTNLVADWFGIIGLGMYINEVKRWVKNGDHLLHATPLEIEKEFGMKNKLHRKKLMLALTVINNETDSLSKEAYKLDYLWVAKWLDDIGLPQHKEAFIDARVDGCVLHNLTIEDILYLKVISQLHLASIRRGIEILRIYKFSNNFLKRRELQDDIIRPAQVAIWSSHRVMEWLKSIDLAEYATNLRGSGVHGAFIVFEPRFNSDLLSTLLSIPVGKTLLRRHISTHFDQLIGPEILAIKRDAEEQVNFVSIVPSSKIKAFRRNQFTLLKRKTKSNVYYEDFVCPFSISKNESNTDENMSILTGSAIESIV